MKKINVILMITCLMLGLCTCASKETDVGQTSEILERMPIDLEADAKGNQASTPLNEDEKDPEEMQSDEIPEQPKKEIDFLVLVNSEHAVPEGWEEELDLVSTVNSVGDEVWTERTAYEAYLELKEDLEKNDGIEIDLDSAYRSVAYQQDIKDRFTEKYGAAYAARTVAEPGYSEHHTGLALDLYFRLDGEDVYYNEDLVKYPEVWKKIHAKLPDHGFILRYPGENGKLGHEPWHIRYVGLEAAKVITAEQISLEEYVERNARLSEAAENNAGDGN